MKDMSPIGLSGMIRLLLVICLLSLLGFKNISLVNFNSEMIEICENAIDDDADGLIDLNDPDCECEIVEPISLIPNPSFEDMNCCPSDRSQLNCAEVWIQASEPTTDFIHTCDYLGWPDFPPPFPFPDGDGIMGFRDGRVRGNGGIAERDWKEYAGACLLSPLEKDSSYRFEFHVGFVNPVLSPAINISFFGTADCDNLPFGVGDDAFGCPTNGPNWVRLGSANLNGGGGNKWVKSFIEVVPEEDILAIAIGPDCPHVIADRSIYYFFDNLLLADFRSFELQVKETTHPCAAEYGLAVELNEAYDYQWFKDSIALVGEESAELFGMYGAGNYQVRINDGISCRVSVAFEHIPPIIDAPVSVTICEEDVYPFGDLMLSQNGIYIDTFKSVNNCDSIVTLELKVLGKLADTVRAKIFEGESFRIDSKKFKEEGEHLAILESNIGCDSLVLLQLEFFHLYFPNVFSPNEDGINDTFRIYGEEGLIQSYSFSVFDRWGNQVYTGEEWDGSVSSGFGQEGVYFFHVEIVMNDGLQRTFAGEISILR